MAASRRTGSSHTAGTSGQPRQLPGSACEECRKRKLRCDRQRPQCGTCADAGIACEVNNNRLARGPKKGDLKALRSRIVALERRLSIDHGEAALTAVPDHAVAGVPMAATLGSAISASGSEGDLPTLASPGESQSAWGSEIHVQVPPTTPTSVPMSFSAFKFPPTPPSPPRGAIVDDLLRADLDQLYFDRVHPNIPIFNHSRYFSRSRQPPSGVEEPNYLLVVQYAMWTLAMAFSSQFESSRDSLYADTRQMLEALDMADNERQPVRIEQVQAWLFIAFYEFARSSYHRASISAGRAFRLVQVARLHALDGPQAALDNEDAISREERRRTFWVAYCLDRLICLISRCPLTLNEEVVSTRLPSPELAFQTGHPVPGCFLSEAMSSGDHNFLSPLADCAVLVTICGRALSHLLVTSVERAFGGASIDFWLRHEWLDAMLTRALDSLSRHVPLISAVADPMLLFVCMMAHATTIFMCQIAVSSGMDDHYRPAILEYQRRATRAAQEIAGLANAHEQIGYFKAHIFMPLAVFLGASQLTADEKQRLERQRGFPSPEIKGGIEPVLEGQFQCCVDALHKIQSFNNLARHHLDILEAQREFRLGGL